MFSQCLVCKNRYHEAKGNAYGCNDNHCSLANGFLGQTSVPQKEPKKVDLLEVVKIQHDIIKKIISHISNDSRPHEIHYETCSDIVDLERLLEEEC